MKKLLLLCIVLFSLSVYSQEVEFKEYSYAEFFNLIEKETDTIFHLKNAIIKPAPDEKERFNYPLNYMESKLEVYDSIHVTKHLRLENVSFKTFDFKGRKRFGLSYIIFHKSVELINTHLAIIASNFKGYLKVSTNSYSVNGLFENNFNKWFLVTFSKLEKGIDYNATDANNEWYFALLNCEIWNSTNSRFHSSFMYDNQKDFSLFKNKFLGGGMLTIRAREGANIDIQKNVFELDYSVFEFGRKAVIKQINFNKNTFTGKVALSVSEINDQHILDWPQFANRLISEEAYNFYNFFILIEKDESNAAKLIEEYTINTSTSFEHYLNIARIENDETYRTEMKLRGRLYKLYKEQYATDFANASYIELKDLETQRLEFLYNHNPSFKSYFTWRTNLFLKVFSAYGTEPARAIIFSFYVILFFAIIYLFFPNSWDKHGKYRIVDRYNFFFKYMKRQAGIHEVYLEDQQEVLMSYDQFKANITNSEQQVPKFFTATALPLYKWAISGTKFSAAILKRIDIMKGTWSELPKHKRIWKSILLIGAFTIAIIYDVFIKMLNALMLSINTFTTLGFGEIPIKGLPRYLAIIQGFIGWFMLTIFSVSLISQLLN